MIQQRLVKLRMFHKEARVLGEAAALTKRSCLQTSILSASWLILVMLAGHINNSQMIFRQGSIDVLRFSLDLSTQLQQIYGPLLAFVLSLPLVMFFLILIVVTTMRGMR